MAGALFIARLIECHTTRATAEVEGRQITISTALTPDAENGDTVLVDHGFALRRLSQSSIEPSAAGMDVLPNAPIEL